MTMQNPSDQSNSAEANLPEKPAPVQVNPAPHHSGHYQQFQPLQMPKAEPFRPSRSFSGGKLTLACFNFVFALVVLGLSIGALTITLGDAILFIISGAMALISVLWQIAEFTTLTVRHSIHRPIHPGAHIGVHLVLWVLALLVFISCCASLSFVLSYYAVNAECTDNFYNYGDGDTYVECGYYNFTSDGQAHKYLGIFEALTAFSALMLLSHFVLFVLACVEADRRRKHGKQSKVVYLIASTAPGDGGLYYLQAPPRVPETAAVADPEPGGYFAPPAAAAAAASSSR